jgi:hypothetical protein
MQHLLGFWVVRLLSNPARWLLGYFSRIDSEMADSFAYFYF